MKEVQKICDKVAKDIISDTNKKNASFTENKTEFNGTEIIKSLSHRSDEKQIHNWTSNSGPCTIHTSSPREKTIIIHPLIYIIA